MTLTIEQLQAEIERRAWAESEARAEVERLREQVANQINTITELSDGWAAAKLEIERLQAVVERYGDALRWIVEMYPPTQDGAKRARKALEVTR